MKYEYYIGIDPDVNASGYAIWNSRTKELELYVKTFNEIMEDLSGWSVSVKVIIEAGWLNRKASWHESKNMSTASRIGSYIGANHQTGKHIVDLCVYFGIDYELVQPKKRKMNHEQFVKITRYNGRTNPEKRDAGMLVFGI